MSLNRHKVPWRFMIQLTLIVIDLPSKDMWPKYLEKYQMTSNPALAPLAYVNIEGHTVPTCPLTPVGAQFSRSCSLMLMWVHICPNFQTEKYVCPNCLLEIVKCNSFLAKAQFSRSWSLALTYAPLLTSCRFKLTGESKYIFPENRVSAEKNGKTSICRKNGQTSICHKKW